MISLGLSSLAGVILALVEPRVDDSVVFPIGSSAIVGYDLSAEGVRWRRDLAACLPGDGNTEFEVELLEVSGPRLAFDRDVDFIACTNFVEVGDLDCDGDRDHAFGLYLLPVPGKADCSSRLVIVSGRKGATIRSETLAHEETTTDRVGSLLPGSDPEGSGQRGVFVTLPHILVEDEAARGEFWFVPADRERPMRFVEITECPSNPLRRRGKTMAGQETCPAE